MWYWNGMGLWGWLMMVAFWVLVALLIVWIVRSAPTAPRQEEGDRSLRILDERLARGQIDREDHEERRQVLESHR